MRAFLIIPINQRLKGSYEFHVARQARERYGFEEAIFQLNGNVLLADFAAARRFAQKMNGKRDLVRYPEQAVKAGQINAMGLIDEILHLVVGLYKQQKSPEVIGLALEALRQNFGEEAVNRTLGEFVVQFPPVAVFKNGTPASRYLEGETAEVANREIALEELLALWLANANPAFAPYGELFDEADLTKKTRYAQIIEGLQQFFELQAPFGPQQQNLVDMLRSPAIAAPHSLSGQLAYIRRHWGELLGEQLARLLSSLDLIAEESRVSFAGKGKAEVYDYSAWGQEGEAERFSPDQDWMPSLVLIAKNAHVWLAQLSKKYGREITRLDQIPDEELDTLSGWGFSGLWLIGLWERSRASRKIKQMRGNQEALASAYSLYDYEIAAELGGGEAAQNLRERAWQRGMRLASDMVPNHMGIDSRWVIEHPDWFLSLPHSPYPAYSFNGPDLAEDGRVGVYIEDHYFDHSDAAVTFLRRDHHSGDSRYIYHGNDGTGMPWNDTAQLDFSKPEVREAVIQTILHVARQFPIIRFDAAMTLAKRHIQRLWFPEPGSGGAIPSRAEHGLTRAEFEKQVPQEFWREVVDRVAKEAPDTLLLAEAFWLMEGYFVRTLGMHRVYNSAFMHMLRDEDNAKYRQVMKNTLEYDPRILKRFVNFMSNPDEDTAEAQFGKGDKYFGVCVMMVTLPGLPMFGHGQVEGYTEKYGMEFQRPMREEEPDEGLVAHHERLIFPLLKRRRLFAEVEQFLLYDFFTPGGSVNEDVFAYSNQLGEARALVVYHNKYGGTQGWIRSSAAYSVSSGGNGAIKLVQKRLSEGLRLGGEDEAFWVFRDQVSGQAYIRSARELSEKGLYLELGAYEAHVFLDFRKVYDSPERPYAALADSLGGQGTPNIEEAMREMFLQPLHRAFKELVNADSYRALIDQAQKAAEEGIAPQAREEVGAKLKGLFAEAKSFANGSGQEGQIAEVVVRDLEAVLSLGALRERYPLPGSRKYVWLQKRLTKGLESNDSGWSTLLHWTFTHRLGAVETEEGAAQASRDWMEAWLLDKIVAQTGLELGQAEAAAWHSMSVAKLLEGQEGWYQLKSGKRRKAYTRMQAWLEDPEVREFLGVNRYEEVLWFNQEAMEEFLWWMLALAAVEIPADASVPEREVAERLVACYDVVNKALKNIEASDYQVEKLLELLKP